ncbi:Lrp/AsnC ligand binding domain-containing protein [Lentisphaerota bacterium ZTH]|nr:Lrp/AsnC ligand binding domain-containing protein [Lentisphaerota bacterium]WET05276.1 Lrp/AsnC ligand binding domain-containing protein [Lentisphaerota bacterium ZTH]
MVTGIVLVNVKRPQLKQVIKGLMSMDGVSEVYTVAGEYDLVVMVRAKDNAQLSDVVANKMTHELDGIRHTKTLISLDESAKVNLREVFC